MLPISPALLGPAMGAALLLGGISAGWAWLRLVHDPAIRAEYAAEIEAQVSAERALGQERAIKAVSMAEAEFQERQLQTATIRERIIRVPVSTACVHSPAIAAALDGLRAWPSTAGQASDPRITPGLPKATQANDPRK